MVVKRGIAVSLPLCAALPSIAVPEPFSIAVPEPFSIELTGDSNGVTLMARCTQGSIVKQQLAAHYPGVVIHEVPRIKTPLLLQEGEQAWSTTMRVEGPKFLPLRTFHDRDLSDQGSDPLITLVGSLSNLDAGERVSTRLYLQSLGPLWSQPHREHAHTTRTAEPNDTSYTCQTRPLQTDGFALTGWAHWRRRKSRRAARIPDTRPRHQPASRRSSPKTGAHRQSTRPHRT